MHKLFRNPILIKMFHVKQLLENYDATDRDTRKVKKLYM